MNGKPKILLLYARFGEGHYQAATALQQQFQSMGIPDAKPVNLFGEAHPLWDAVSRFFYANSARYFPKLYGWSYHATNRMNPDSPFGKWLHSFGMRRMGRLLKQERPDAVIHTFPFLAMCQLRQTTGDRTPIFTVITDYVLHNRWIHSETDGYFAATEEVKDALAARGVRRERIVVSGIPVRGLFERPVLNPDTYRKFGLARDKSYVLLLGGVYGDLSALADMMEETARQREHAGFIVVAGRNIGLYDKLRAKAFRLRDVKVLGFVDEIEQLMLLASCIVTKAGGITLTEALRLGKPLIVFRPLPGQEKGNADFWANRGALSVARDVAELKAGILARLDRCGNAAAAVAAADGGFAARTIAEAVLARIAADAEDAAPAQPVVSGLRGRRVTHEY